MQDSSVTYIETGEPEKGVACQEGEHPFPVVSANRQEVLVKVAAGDEKDFIYL